MRIFGFGKKEEQVGSVMRETLEEIFSLYDVDGWETTRFKIVLCFTVAMFSVMHTIGKKRKDRKKLDDIYFAGMELAQNYQINLCEFGLDDSDIQKIEKEKPNFFKDWTHSVDQTRYFFSYLLTNKQRENMGNIANGINGPTGCIGVATLMLVNQINEGDDDAESHFVELMMLFKNAFIRMGG